MIVKPAVEQLQIGHTSVTDEEGPRFAFFFVRGRTGDSKSSLLMLGGRQRAIRSSVETRLRRGREKAMISSVKRKLKNILCPGVPMCRHTVRAK